MQSDPTLRALVAATAPAAAAPAAADPDAALLALVAEWWRLHLAPMPPQDDSPELLACVARIEGLKARIAATPARGGLGVAAKAQLVALEAGKLTNDREPCLIVAPDDLEESALRDAKAVLDAAGVLGLPAPAPAPDADPLPGLYERIVELHSLDLPANTPDEELDARLMEPMEAASLAASKARPRSAAGALAAVEICLHNQRVNAGEEPGEETTRAWCLHDLNAYWTLRNVRDWLAGVVAGGRL